ncbi:unnamed protein product [Calypogeia fissa]
MLSLASYAFSLSLSSGVTVVSILVTIVVLYPSLQKWRLFFKSFIGRGRARFIWRKAYSSFEDMHALFDRGDALMAAVGVAITLQLSHEEVGNVLKAHSYVHANPMRRMIRTLTFILITVRSNSKERSQVVKWLHQLHRPIKLFELKTNVFILATIAYGLGRAHQVLGAVTDFEVDALVSSIMNMAKIVTPEEGQDMNMPTTLREVTDYLSKQIKFDPSDLKESSTMNRYVMVNVAAHLPRKKGGRKVGGALRPKLQASMFFQPLSWLKFYTFVHLIRDLSSGIFASGSPDFKPGPVLWVFQKLQPVFRPFHYTLCPGFLTFDGLFELLGERDPALRLVADEVYAEIFGPENAAKTKWRQSKEKNMSAHLPHVKNEDGTAPPSSTNPSSVYSDVMEHLKCAYLRGQLQGHSVPQHLGVIMDGNRRFSKQNHLGGPLKGHEMGARKLLECMSWCFSSGVRNLTVWALSDDNLKRGMGELDPLFTMMAGYIQEIVMGDTPISVLEIRFRVVGDRSILPGRLCKIIDAAERATRHNSRFNLQLALGYGGRAEATRAMKRAVEFQAREKGLSMEEALSSLTPGDVSKQTYSSELGLPEIDAILRTSGEKRLSGFALWETHGAEISFVEAHWPALKESDFLQSIMDLSGRNRRFGA